MDFVGFPLQSILSNVDEAQARRLGQGKGDDRITLILDTKGCIQYCSAPAMFSLGERELQGQPVTAVIPGLPFRARTPGYNVAYTRFAFDSDRWYRHTVKLGEERSVSMDLMVRAIPVNHGYCLLVLLKPVGEEFAEKISVRKPQLRYVPSSQSARTQQGEAFDTDVCVAPVRLGEPMLLRVASGW